MISVVSSWTFHFLVNVKFCWKIPFSCLTMYNYQSPVKVPESNLYNKTTRFRDVSTPLPMSPNKYVYVKQNFINPSHIQAKPVIQKVLVNPHFTKKIFVNPNFKVNNCGPTACAPKIHVNPNVQKLNIGVTDKDCTSVQKIHVNPNVLRNIPVTRKNTLSNSDLPTETNKQNTGIVHLTENKLKSHVDFTNKNTLRKRRSSVRSKFKIIKSSLLENSAEKLTEEKRRVSIKSKYKIIKCNYSPLKRFTNTANKFKVDNRNWQKIILPQKNKKYVYVNRFLSISDIARNNLLKCNNKFKKSNLLNVSGVIYKKSPNCLRRTSIIIKADSLKRAETSTSSKSKFKFVKKSSKVNIAIRDQPKLLRSPKIKKTISPGKLRICNIPCPYYRKYGRCKGKDNGKCYRKHDPDQIALCTKFLQGACINNKCLLSHNVSPEKMPTCKFYLEGSCSRDDCPYLHVRINPKADICRDFLVGFCRKASQCDKRHQFLCPDFEKNGSCLKQRCQYPHGKMVRKYSVFNKNKFAKKSSKSKTESKSDDINKEIKVTIGKEVMNSENLKIKTSESCVKNRYYVESNFDLDECKDAVNGDNHNCIDLDSCDQENGIRSRPKLGKLPSFIAFEEV